MKKHNFNAGPSILPDIAIEETIKALRDFAGTGMSIMEVSHRTKEFEAVVNDSVQLFKELLNIPDGYTTIFLGGGASLQFCMVPFNFLNKKAAYLQTGEWASRAVEEAKKFGEVVVVANSKDKNFSYIPKNYEIPKDADYFHITTNNTIFGTELRKDIDCPIPLIADMSSDIFSRPVDISKYAMIYGGAQKNLAPAGVTFVIIRNDFLNKIQRPIPTMLDYRIHVKNNSLYNTPPCTTIFTALQTLKWLKANGGLVEMEKRNIEKAKCLYDAIDNSKMFIGTVEKEDRSLMNICFVMKPEFVQFEEEFAKFADSKGMIGIKGHRSVGGFRASTYNALPLESVKALVECMKEFEKSKA